MMTLKKLFPYSIITCCILFLSSCLDDNNNDTYYPNALVTVKYTDSNEIYLQLDDSITLLPVNMKESIFGGKQVRALCNFKDADQSSGSFSKAVYVNWIDSILTKNMVPNLDTANTVTYGNDPVEIVNDWVTIAEDGYLTLRFRTLWGDSSKAHIVNLVAGDSTNPYTIEFRQNAQGDIYGELGDGIVAFKLDRLPDTAGKTVDVTLKWNSFEGEKSVTFNYNSTNTSSVGKLIVNERIDNSRIE